MANRTNTNFGGQILSILRHTVSGKILKAIDMIIHPCCDFTIEDIDFTCTATSVATITITLEGGVSFPGTAQATLFSSENGEFKTVTYTPGATSIAFTGFPITNAATDVTYTVLLKFSTSTDVAKGVYVSNTIVSDNPTCS